MTHSESSMEATLVFVRHGQTESNVERRFMGHLDSPLSALGREQAEAVARRVGAMEVGALYTSDLGRAAATAATISATCGVPAVQDARLRERHAGIFQGLLISEARERFPDHFSEMEEPDPSTSVPGGESGFQVRARLALLLDEVVKRHPGQRVVLVTHGIVIRTLLWHFLETSYALTRRARVDNTSLTVFRSTSGKWALQTWNDTAHLAAPNPLG